MTTKQITAKEYRIWVRQNYNTEDYTIRERETTQGFLVETLPTQGEAGAVVVSRLVLTSGGNSYFLHAK